MQHFNATFRVQHLPKATTRISDVGTLQIGCGSTIIEQFVACQMSIELGPLTPSGLPFERRLSARDCKRAEHRDNGGVRLSTITNRCLHR